MITKIEVRAKIYNFCSYIISDTVHTEHENRKYWKIPELPILKLKNGGHSRCPPFCLYQILCLWVISLIIIFYQLNIYNI